MNSLVSYNWLKEYVDLKGVKPEEFARRVSLSGPGVEKIVPAGHGLENVVVGHVLEVKPHPNADKLRLAVTDIGKKKVTIVCGGSNLAEGQWVAVALEGAMVRWHGEGDPIELKPAEIRGVKSEGMVCAANEIGLFDAFPHAEREILVLAGMHGLKAGMPLADALGLSDDVIMDIEVTSNRVDAMGMVGMAREAAAILDKKFLWKPAKLVSPRGSAESPKVTVREKKLCSRYMAVRIEGVTVGPSPWWLKKRLMSAGLNSINNIVDITNYVLLEHAQPLHAFDAATVEKGIEVRLARNGEKISALDGKEYPLDNSMLVVADSKKPIAIAGVMGGEETGITAGTTSILLESATFDPVSIRRTARKLNLQSDSQLRFEKGLSSEAPPYALARAIELVLEIAGGKLAVPIADVKAGKHAPLRYSISSDEVSAHIGVDLPQKNMVAILKRLGFGVTASGKKITATVPWWRDHDIEDGRDLVEEIARIEGYANIPAVVPIGLAQPISPELAWEKRVRDISKGAGMTEAYTYSFVSKDLLAKAGYDATGMLNVQNPLSADFEVMRTTLLPSLLDAARENRERAAELRIFEVANVYYPRDNNLPDEQLEVGAVFVGMDEPWRHAKGYVEHVLREMGIKDVSWRRLSTDPFWHPGRTAQAFSGDALLATVGEISPKISAAFKLDAGVGMVDMPLEQVIDVASSAKSYVPIPQFPEAKRDLAVIVDQHAEYADISAEIMRAGAQHPVPLQLGVEWFDTYSGKGLADGKKSVAMHLTLSAPDRTLESAEVDAMMEKITAALSKAFKAEVRD